MRYEFETVNTGMGHGGTGGHWPPAPLLVKQQAGFAPCLPKMASLKEIKCDLSKLDTEWQKMDLENFGDARSAAADAIGDAVGALQESWWVSPPQVPDLR